MAKVYDFPKDLAQYGPGVGEPKEQRDPVSRVQAADYCRELTRSHYENFSVVSWFLPKRLLKPFEAVYAFCRWSDDLGDETGGPEQALPLLNWWQQELETSWAQPHNAVHPVMVALAAVREEHDLEIDPFLRLIQAFKLDQTKNRFGSRAELLAYCHNSADPVGEIVLTLFGKKDPTTLPLSHAICTGLQLANFWQDLSRDLDINRIYLPVEDQAQWGINEADLFARKATEPIRALLKQEVDWAAQCFEQGRELPALVGGTLGAQIGLFWNGGRAILNRIRTEGYRSLETRPRLTKWDKGRLLLGGLTGWLLGPLKRGRHALRKTNQAARSR